MLALCRADLTLAAETGLTGPLLYSVVRMVAAYLKADVLARAGFNHLLKSVIERSHNIKHPLLYARARINKALGVGARGVSARWRLARPAAAKLLQDCVDEHDSGEQVIGDVARYSAPEPLPAPPARDLVNVIRASSVAMRPSHHPGSVVAWAAKHNSLLHKQFPACTAKHCILFGGAPLAAGPMVHLVSEKSHSSSTLLGCRVRADDRPTATAGDFIAAVAGPLQCSLALDHFCAAHADVRRADGPWANGYPVQSFPLSWHFSADHGLFASLSASAGVELFRCCKAQQRRMNASAGAAAGSSDIAFGGGGGPATDPGDPDAPTEPTEPQDGATDLEDHLERLMQSSDLGDEEDDGFLEALGHALLGGEFDEGVDRLDEAIAKDRDEFDKPEGSCPDLRGPEPPPQHVLDAVIAAEPDLAEFPDAVFQEGEELQGQPPEQQQRPAAGGADVGELLQRWAASARLGLETLALRDQDIASTSLGGEYPWTLSLFESEQHVGSSVLRSTLFIKWTSPSSMLGRKVNVRDARSVYPTPANPFFVERSFQSTANATYTCIHPAIWVSPARYKSASRLQTEVPDHIARLQRMWDAAMSGVSGEPSVEVCALCTRDGPSFPVVCPACLLSWHAPCGHQARAGLGEDFDAKDVELPRAFHRGLTAVCAPCKAMCAL